MTDLEKQIIDRLNAYLNTYGIQLLLSDDTIVLCINRIITNYVRKHGVNDTWKNCSEMMYTTGYSLSLFETIKKYFNDNTKVLNAIHTIESHSLEELQIKLDLAGV